MVGGQSVNPIDAFFAQIASPPPPAMRQPLLAASPFPAPGAPIPPAVAVGAAPPPPPPAPVAAGVAAPPPPAETEVPASPKAEQEWVQEERQRLEGYMSKQFAVLQQQREEFSRWRSQVEAALVGREQELNRQTKLLGGRTAELNEREQGLNDRESGMVAVNDQVAAAEESLHAVQESLMQLQLDTDAQRVILEEFREAAQHLQMLTQRAETEYAELRAEVDKDRAAHEQERASVRERKHQLEQRQAAVDHSELAMRQRLAEMEKVEGMIRADLQRKEAELVQRGQMLGQGRPVPPASGPDQTALQRQLAAMSQELATLRRKLAEAPVPGAGSDAERRLRDEAQRHQEELVRNRKEVQERRQELMAEMKTNQNLRQKLAMMSRHLEEMKAKLQAHGQTPAPSPGAAAPLPVKRQ
jgi:chromosome segregation ATPase